MLENDNIYYFNQNYMGNCIPMMPNPYCYPQNYQMALKLIQEAMAGEAEDKLFYDYLIRIAPSQDDKEMIASIRDDELKHFDLFREIYYQLTCQIVPERRAEEFVEPSSYCEGLEQALKGESNAVKKYRLILYAMQNRRHINMLTEIITDELRHADLYNLLYTKNDCHGPDID